MSEDRADRPLRDRAAPPKAMFVYVIGRADGIVKVGISRSPRHRFLALQQHGPDDLSLHGAIQVATKRAVDIERDVHWQLRQFWVRGEWFRVAPETAFNAIHTAIATKFHKPVKQLASRLGPVEVTA